MGKALYEGGFTIAAARRSRGTCNPVVSDGKRLYMTGYTSVTALDPLERRR